MIEKILGIHLVEVDPIPVECSLLDCGGKLSWPAFKTGCFRASRREWQDFVSYLKAPIRRVEPHELKRLEGLHETDARTSMVRTPNGGGDWILDADGAALRRLIGAIPFAP